MLFTSAAVCDVADVVLSDGIGNAAAPRKMHIDLAKLGDDLFCFVSLLRHDDLPAYESHNIRMDHFKGGGSRRRQAELPATDVLERCFAGPSLARRYWALICRAGVEAFERGDYAAAMREWRPLVELGLAECQRHVELSGFRHVKRFQPG